MKIEFELNNKKYSTNFTNGIDISLSIGGDNPNAFGISEAQINPIVVGDFVGSVAQGSGANCDIIQFCAHGNGTHTECIGHITAEHESVNQLINNYFFVAQLISVNFTQNNLDLFIGYEDLVHLNFQQTDAIIIRTLPNEESKKSKKWSSTNPPFFSVEAMQLLVDNNYKHLLTDLPSVDPEHDDGKLSAHHIWWQTANTKRMDASITELIYVPNEIEDGLYLLNLQTAAFESDATPSRPIIFPLVEIN